MGKKHDHHEDRDEQQQSRREQFLSEPRPRRPRVSGNAAIIAAGLVFLGVVIYVSTAGSRAGSSSAEAVAGGSVSLPVSLFDDGQARFYRYTSASGREIRFFVMKSSDGVVRAAFDTCDVCYRERRGYRQAGDVMVCNNCGRSFRSVDINVLQGGCNPAPLDRVIEGGQVVLMAAALERGAGYFQ